MKARAPHALFLVSALALVAALGASWIAAPFWLVTRPYGAPNPKGEIAPDASGALTVCTFGDSKGRTAVWYRAVEDALAREPSVLVHLGDLVEQRSAFEFRYAGDLCDEARQRGLPVYVVIGNHEGFNRKNELEVKDFEGTFGPAVSWFRAHGVLFVSLDTADERSFPEEQARRVDAILAAERPRSSHAVLLTHVPPLAGEPIRDKRGYVKQLPGEDTARLFALVEKYKVELVLGGHYHGSRIDKRGGATYVIAGGGGASLDGPTEFPHYVRATISDAGVTTEVVRVDDGPGVERLRYYLLRYARIVVPALVGTALAAFAVALVLRRRNARR
jgi:predicted phosphodiesterase